MVACPSRARPSPPNDVSRTNGRWRMVGSTQSVLISSLVGGLSALVSRFRRRPHPWRHATMDGVFFIFDSLVLVGGSPSHTSGSLTFPVARDCYERSIPKARNKGVVRIATARTRHLWEWYWGT